MVSICIWEDNNGALKLATNPTKVSVHTKHLAITYHFFCHPLGKDITILKVVMTEQLTDLFTKGLSSNTFWILASKLMTGIHPIYPKTLAEFKETFKKILIP